MVNHCVLSPALFNFENLNFHLLVILCWKGGISTVVIIFFVTNQMLEIMISIVGYEHLLYM
jgi:hypothetical protein